MPFKTSPSPFLYAPTDTSAIMRQVLYALVPGLVIYVYFFGWGVVINVLIASLTALSSEALVLWLRNRPLRPSLSDGSALVTAWLLAAALSPFVPWWMTMLGTAFAIIVVKQLYGGLGYNPFNPAIAGYAMLLISFPADMGKWPALTSQPGMLDSLSIIFNGHPLTVPTLDALSGATLLDTVKNSLKQSYTIQEIQQHPLFGYMGAKSVEVINGVFLLGGLWLLYKRVISWHIPVAVMGSLFLISTFFFVWDSGIYPSPLYHLVSGGVILGAFFIATDPVTAATSNQGRLIYGAGIGILVYIIRTWGGYPDGIAFAVLLMNITAPMIDYYTQPRVFGYPK